MGPQRLAFAATRLALLANLLRLFGAAQVGELADGGWQNSTPSTTPALALGPSREVGELPDREWENSTASTTPPPVPSPIRKVVALLGEMQAQVEREAEADLESHVKYMCWCQTSQAEKAKAIERAGVREQELNAFVQSSAAVVAGLEEAVEAIKADMTSDKDALASAVSLRQQEKSNFAVEHEDSMQSVSLLKEAVDVLSRAQLGQSQVAGGSGDALSDVQEVLVQVRDKVIRGRSKFKSILSRDFYDLMGAWGDLPGAPRSTAFLGRRAPAPPLGSVPGAKSYNPQSGSILGILSGMHDEMQRDVKDMQRAEDLAKAQFEKLHSAKASEIAIATDTWNRKVGELAHVRAAVAKAKEDLDSVAASTAADEQFLAGMQADCAAEKADYEVRSKARSDELQALGEAQKLLTEEDARELFVRTVSFAQLAEQTSFSTLRSRLLHASQHLAVAAGRRRSASLAHLASRLGIDTFADAKAALERMREELRTQQQVEYKKHEFCSHEVGKTEDVIKESDMVQDELKSRHKHLANTLETLQADLVQLIRDEEEILSSLKKAGEHRKQQNVLFQTSVRDQLAAVNILQKVIARLRRFYGFAQLDLDGQEPGAPAPSGLQPTRPPRPQAYRRSAGSGSVLQILQKIVQDAEIEAKDLQTSEQTAQKGYEEMARTATSSVEANRATRAEKAQQIAEMEADLASVQQGLTAAALQKEESVSLLQAHHTQCDFLLKYFSVRQQAREEEMGAIDDAKAILSGTSSDS